jgi:GTP pyrophosphokinase
MPLSPRFDEALLYAAQLHRDQLRKGSGVPYLSHLLAVASIVLDNGGSEDEAIAALLHDAVEDQGGAPTREAIRRRFGDMVVEIINGCTDAETLPKPPWKERKQAFLANLRQASASVRLVAAADKLHNARSIVHDHRQVGAAVWDRFTADKGDILWYYRSVVAILKEKDDSPLVAELEQVVTELAGLA